MARAHKRGDVWHTTDVIPDVLSCFRTLQHTKKSILAVVSLPRLAPRPTRSVCSEVDLRPCNGLVTGIPRSQKKLTGETTKSRNIVIEKHHQNSLRKRSITNNVQQVSLATSISTEVTVTLVEQSPSVSHRGILSNNQRLSPMISTFPHQYSAEGAVLSTISHCIPCTFRSLAYPAQEWSWALRLMSSNNRKIL